MVYVWLKLRFKILVGKYIMMYTNMRLRTSLRGAKNTSSSSALGKQKRLYLTTNPLEIIHQWLSMTGTQPRLTLMDSWAYTMTTNKWRVQVENVCTRVKQRLHFLCRLIFGVNQKVLLLFYQAGVDIILHLYS